MAEQYIKKINGYVIKDEEARSDIEKIKNGEIAVGEASVADKVSKKLTVSTYTSSGPSTVEYDGSAAVSFGSAENPILVANRAATAGSADKATTDASGNTFTSYYATKVEAQTAKDRADAAYALAEGKDNAFVYDTFSAMETDLKNASATKYKVGTQLLIKATDVPDYWISGTLTSPASTTSPSGTKDENDYYTEYSIGYYKITILESQKVDLSGYAQTNGTYSGMTVGNATNAGTATKVSKKLKIDIIGDNGAQTIEYDGSSEIAFGSSAKPVSNASYATSAGSATKATKDASGNVFTSYYATKKELQDEKITLKVVNEELQICKNSVMITPTSS